MSSKSTTDVQTDINASDDPNFEVILAKVKVEALENKIAEHIMILGSWKVKHDKLVRDYYCLLYTSDAADD